MSDKKTGTSPLLARYKSTVDYFYRTIPDTGNEISGNSITLKRKGQNSIEDSGSSVEKKNKLENDEGLHVSGKSTIDASSTNIKASISIEGHDKKEEHKLLIINKGGAFGSTVKKTFVEDKDGKLRIVSQENGVDRNKISSDNVERIHEEPEKEEKFIKTGDIPGSVDEKIFGGGIGKFGYSREISPDENASVDHKTSSIMKITYNEREGKLEMVLEELNSVSKKRGSVCSSDKEDGLGSISHEDSVINANINENLGGKTEKSSEGSIESALKQKEKYVKMTSIENSITSESATKRTCKMFICDVCKVSFSSAEIKHHRQMCPSVVIKRLTVPEMASWLSFSPFKTKVILERLKEKDIQFWSSHKVRDRSSSLSQKFKKDSMLLPASSSSAKTYSDNQHHRVVNSHFHEKEENISASDNKYICGKCRKSFPDVNNLKLHILNHLAEPNELTSSETKKFEEPLPVENPPNLKSLMIATGLHTETILCGSQTETISPGLQGKIVSSLPMIPVKSSNQENHESSTETNKNLANTEVIPSLNSPNFRHLNILHKSNTSVKQAQTTSWLNSQTNSDTLENNVKQTAEVTKNNSWTTQETVAFPVIKQEVDDSLWTGSQSVNTNPTWMSNNLQTSGSLDASYARGTSQVSDLDRQFTNHFSRIPNLHLRTVGVTPDVKVKNQDRRSCHSEAYLDLCWLARDDRVSSGVGSQSKLTSTSHELSGVGSQSKLTSTSHELSGGSPVPNRSSLIVSKSLFSHGKKDSPLKSPVTSQKSSTPLSSPSNTAKTKQNKTKRAKKDESKNSNQAKVKQLSDKRTGLSQKSLSKKIQTSQKKSKRKSIASSADFKCTMCSTILRTADELRKHEVVHMLSNKLKAIVNRVKKAEEFVCGLCKMCFVKEEQLRNHMQCVHRSQNNPVNSSQAQVEEFVCGVCKQIFDTDNDLRMHMTTFHRVKIEDSEENEVFYCGICNKSFQTASELENHMPVHTRDKFVCGICNQPFIQSKDLIDHMGSHAGTSAL